MNAIFKQCRAGVIILSIIIASHAVYAQDELRVWREFVDTLMSGRMTTEKIHPHPEFDESFKSTLLGFLQIAKKEARQEDWDTIPETIRRDSFYHYIIPLTTKQERVPYCFTFVTDGSSWYFRHLEAIFIRLDTLSVLPATVFPDVSERQKAWAREEIYWSFIILNVYLPVVRESGKETALNRFRDGGGYFVGAKTWIPFSPPHKAFIQYLCWEQARLRNNEVELRILTDTEAVVQIQSHYFAIYDIASHLKPVISPDDYKQIFKKIWQDRAAHAGWGIDIKYLKDYVVEFRFKRGS